MRKVGVFIDASDLPTLGGGHTFNSSIIKGLKKHSTISNKFELYFIYESENDISNKSEFNKILNLKNYQSFKENNFFLKKVINKLTRTLINKNI